MEGFFEMEEEGATRRDPDFLREADGHRCVMFVSHNFGFSNFEFKVQGFMLNDPVHPT